MFAPIFCVVSERIHGRKIFVEFEQGLFAAAAGDEIGSNNLVCNPGVFTDGAYELCVEKWINVLAFDQNKKGPTGHPHEATESGDAMLRPLHRLNVFSSGRSAIISGECVAMMSCVRGFSCRREGMSLFCQSTCIESSGSSIIREWFPARMASSAIKKSCFSPDERDGNRIFVLSATSTVISFSPKTILFAPLYIDSSRR